MNITDKLYNEWAWRTKTGTPNINNPEDKVILESLISFKRAGANAIVTYYADHISNIMNDK